MPTAAYQRALDQRLFDDRPSLSALAPYTNNRQPGEERRLVVLLERRPVPTVKEVPSFVPPTRTFMRRVRDASPQLAALVFYAVALVSGAVVAFERLRL